MSLDRTLIPPAKFDVVEKSASLFDNLAVKVINLKHREDRKKLAIEELNKAGIKEYTFVEGRYVKELGARGCSLSQAKALSDFMFYDEKEFVLIFEDDFKVEYGIDLIQVITEVLKKSKEWDVFMLAHAGGCPMDVTDLRVGSLWANRTIASLTSSAYIVKRSFVPTLIKSAYDSSEYLKRWLTLPPENQILYKHHTVCDVLWHPLQLTHVFWAFYPACIKQRASYSDIEYRDVDYDY